MAIEETIPRDFKEFLKLLEDEDVDYLLEEPPAFGGFRPHFAPARHAEDECCLKVMRQ